MSFNVTEYRSKFSTAQLVWRRVPSPYKFHKFNYTVSANNRSLESAEVHGCFEPVKSQNVIQLDSDIIKVKFQVFGGGWLLIGKSNCNSKSTDVFLKIDTRAEEETIEGNEKNDKTEL